jgi:hypothetical protein
MAFLVFSCKIKDIPSTDSIPGWNLLVVFGHGSLPVDLVVLDLKIPVTQGGGLDGHMIVLKEG